jgi:hypothetical protein
MASSNETGHAINILETVTNIQETAIIFQEIDINIP